jgi:hypothetical protein
MKKIFDKSYINVGGCWYPRDYKWVAYPCSSYPHGGVFNKLPDYYQDYERERKKAQERAKRAREKEEQDRWSEYARRFAQGFFGFNDEEPSDKKLDKDYPYCVFGLSKSASDDDMKKAYRKSVLRAHPDKGGTPELFRKVREAWDYFKSYLSTQSPV